MASSSNESKLPYLGFGLLFGYFLSKARATDYDTIVDMFLCRDFQLYGVILTAIMVIAAGFFLLRFSSRGLIGMVLLIVAFGFFCSHFGVWALGVFALAVLGGYIYLKKNDTPMTIDQVQDWEPLDWDPERLMGAFLLGVGWALSGTCPGTSLTQIGEGKLVAIFTVAGILLGVWAYRKYKPGASSKDQVC